MFLSDIKIVDLKRSIVDEGKSGEKVGQWGRKGGNYVFKSKKYTDYKNAAIRPEWWLSWNRNHDREIRNWQAKWKYEFVTVNDPFWPDNVAPDAEGKYVFGDAVLMKCPLIEYVKKRNREIAKSDRAARDKLKEFEIMAEQKGAKIDESLLERIL